jgi:hypothetical protein
VALTKYWLRHGLEYRVDQLYKALLEHPPGLTLTEITIDVFHCGVRRDRMRQIIEILQERGLAIVREEVNVLTHLPNRVVTATRNEKFTRVQPNRVVTATRNEKFTRVQSAERESRAAR